MEIKELVNAYDKCSVDELCVCLCLCVCACVCVYLCFFCLMVRWLLCVVFAFIYNTDHVYRFYIYSAFS